MYQAITQDRANGTDYQLFPTTVWVRGCAIDNLAHRCLAEQLRDPQGRQVSNLGDNWQSNDLGDSWQDVTDQYLQHARDLMRDHCLSEDVYEPYVQSTWINISGTGGFNFIHDHWGEDAFVSFVHYVMLPPNTYPRLIFRSDRPSLKFWQREVTAPSALTTQEFALLVEEQQLVLFPSWLDHRTKPLPTGKKISIAGNISVRRKSF